MSTALNMRGKNGDLDEELIMGVIFTAREMKRMIRKHSIEIKKESVGKRAEIGIELPPLVMKRGNTSAF